MIRIADSLLKMDFPPEILQVSSHNYYESVAILLIEFQKNRISSNLGQQYLLDSHFLVSMMATVQKNSLCWS